MYYIPKGLTAATLLLSTSLTRTALADTKADYTSNALNATDVLQQHYYDQSTGLWDNLWWQSGVILATTGDVAILSSDYKDTAVNVFSNTIVAAKANNPSGAGSFLNNFYDDEGWWALGFIKAYDVTGDTQYLDAAKDIFQDLLTGNDATCGGHWWSKDRQANTAIGNELYLSTAASLANRATGDDKTTYQQYAQASVDWFLGSGLINSDNTINDGLDTSTCQPEGNVYSYNQGVILGALIEMSTLTGNTSYLDTASAIAHGAIAALATPNNGILTEGGYPNDTGIDGAEFKGIFVRNLKYLQAVRPDDAFVSFLQANADSIWSTDRGADGTMGEFWEGPMEDPTGASHSSALDCLVAAAVVTQ